MVAIYIILLICMAMLIFGAYHAIINVAVWGVWMFGISLFIIFAVALGFAMFG